MSSNKQEELAPRRRTITSVKEQKQNRLIIIGFIITAALIVGMVAYAFLYDGVIKNRIPVARIDNAKVDNEYFKQRVILERNSYIQQFNSLYAQYQMFAQDETYAQYFTSQLSQIQLLLDDHQAFGQKVLDNIIDEQIKVMEAEKMGLTASEVEVDEMVMEAFGFFPHGTPTPAPTATTFATPTVSTTQKALLGATLTPTATLEITPEAQDAEGAVSPQPDAVEETAESIETEDAVPVEDESVATPESEGAEAAQTPQPSATPTEEAQDPTPLPTATVYTEELYLQNYANYVSSMETAGVKEKYLRQYLKNFLLMQKLQEEISKQTPLEQEQVWARHILVETEEEAKALKARLDKGEDWNALAAEASTDTSNSANGGDLGWFQRGLMVEPFDKVAFDQEVGTISDPVQTDFGWHLIQVIGHETRPLSASDYSDAQQTYFDDWYAELKARKSIKINDVWKDIVPKEPSLYGE